jgi:hypothetical protein
MPNSKLVLHLLAPILGISLHAVWTSWAGFYQNSEVTPEMVYLGKWDVGPAEVVSPEANKPSKNASLGLADQLHPLRHLVHEHEIHPGYEHEKGRDVAAQVKLESLLMEDTFRRNEILDTTIRVTSPELNPL